ncbi:MAG: DinB family protein [Ginsengibacter sp.]
MKIGSIELINHLVEKVENAKKSVENLNKYTVEQLNAKSHGDAWSTLECLEHLNLYGDFYLQEIENKILQQKKQANKSMFNSGLVGNYFANLMMVKNGKIKKMKTPTDMNPGNSTLTKTTIQRFLKQQEKLIRLLNQAKEVDLTNTKTAIKLTRLIKLRLGDTFRFLVYHIERHILQAEKSIIQ